MDSICKKCGGDKFHTEKKGGNTGLYCNKCGTWMKWLGKNELRAFTYQQEHPETNVTTAINTDQPKAGQNDESVMVQRLKDFVAFLDKKIENEYSKLPISDVDAVRKGSYCLALEQDKRAIINILSGRDFGDHGD